MAIAHEFDYVKPRTLREAVKTLARYGTRARVLAGGTDLITLIAEDVVTPGRRGGHQRRSRPGQD